jgi:hypothetical protein
MKINKRSLFVLLSLVFVVSGPILLSLIHSNRSQVEVYRGEVEPVREDPYAGIEPELLQAMKDVNSAREPEDRTMANEKFIAHGKEINSNLDAGKDAIKQEIQGQSLNGRLGLLAYGMDGYTLQEKVEVALTLEDLPQLHAALDEPERANQWWAAVTAIAILEPDKEKAFKSLDDIFKREEDWVALHKRYPGRADMIAREKFCAVSGFGYINSDKANDLLLQLMKKEEAHELVLKSGDTLLGFLDEYEGTELVQSSAAQGIMVTRNEELIPYLIDANILAAAEFQKDHGVHSGRLVAGLNSILGMHYYYKDHGWEGGYRLSAIMDVPVYPVLANVPVRTYYDEYITDYYIVSKVYKLQYERGLVTTDTKYYLEKSHSVD